MEENKKPVEITRREIHKAVRNYMANELGFDRTQIAEILSQQIDKRNPGKMVQEAVEKYFVGRDRWRAGEYVEKTIETEVRNVVRNIMANGARAHMEQMVKHHLDSIYAQNGHSDGPFSEAPPAELPIGSERYGAATWLPWNAVMDYVREEIMSLTDSELANGTEIEKASHLEERAIFVGIPKEKSRTLFYNMASRYELDVANVCKPNGTGDGTILLMPLIQRILANRAIHRPIEKVVPLSKGVYLLEPAPSTWPSPEEG